MSALNLRFDCDAPGDRPNRLSAGQAVSTNFRSAASAFGAMSVATTCNPLARNSELQLAPITPVPMMAMRRMGLFCDMSLLLRDFGVCDAGEVALCVQEVALVGSVEPCGVDRARKISDEHAIAGDVQRDADPFHQVSHHDFGLGRLVVDGSAVHRVAARWIAAVGPVDDAVLVIDLKVDRLRQRVEEYLDIG